VNNVDVVTRYYSVVTCCSNEIHIHRITYLLSYLVTHEYRETFRRELTADLGLLIAVDCGCGSLIKLCVLMRIKVLRSAHLLTGQHHHGNSTAGHPPCSPAPLPPPSALTGRMLSGQSTKQMAFDATIDARVVMSFACVE